MPRTPSLNPKPRKRSPAQRTARLLGAAGAAVVVFVTALAILVIVTTP